MTATVPSQGLNNHLTKYEYDPLYQLTKATYPTAAPFNGEVDSWTYDAIGNRLTNTVNGSTQNYSYQKIGANPLNWQRLLSDGSNSYTYDANGDTTTRSGPGGNVTFGWNSDGRLTNSSGAVSASYGYDYLGKQSAKTLGAVATTYLYTRLDLIREATPSTADYLFGPGIDEPLAVSRGGLISYYQVDALGSVSLLTDSAGTVLNSYVYDTWGADRFSSATIGNPFAYTAREFAEAASLLYRARRYQPSSGRFLSEDPLRFLEGTNWYAYAGNAPSHFRDPLGLSLPCDRNPYCSCRNAAKQNYDWGKRRCEEQYDDCSAGCEPECQPPFTSVPMRPICLFNCELQRGACHLGNGASYQAQDLRCEYYKWTPPRL